MVDVKQVADAADMIVMVMHLPVAQRDSVF